MKKLQVLLVTLAIAAFAQAANVWNFDWTINYAYSPDDGVTKNILDYYSVTWSLIDTTSGDTIHSFNSVAGSLIFDDTDNGGGYGSYNKFLFPIDGEFTYLGKPQGSGEQSLAMRIDLSGDGGDYWWQSDPTSVKIQTSSETPPDAPWETVVIGTEASTDTRVNAIWTKVTTIPEPATMSLLGLGALAMILRRRIRR